LFHQVLTHLESGGHVGETVRSFKQVPFAITSARLDLGLFAQIKPLVTQLPQIV